MQNTWQIQKYHFGLVSSSFSVNSLYWYHSDPNLPTGNGGLTKISTGLGTWTAKCNSPQVSTDTASDILCDLPTGSTVNHPRPDMATSQAGLLPKNHWEISYFYTVSAAQIKLHPIWFRYIFFILNNKRLFNPHFYSRTWKTYFLSTKIHFSPILLSCPFYFPSQTGLCVKSSCNRTRWASDSDTFPRLQILFANYVLIQALSSSQPLLFRLVGSAELQLLSEKAKQDPLKFLSLRRQVLSLIAAHR